MNELIRKIFSQSERYALDNANNQNDEDFEYSFEDDLLTKFAELIVKECINVALTQKLWVEDQKIFNQQDDIWNRARIQQSERIIDKIKEHFGVEE